VRGAPRVLDALKERLEIDPGQTTKDRKFTLETVNCLGTCAIAPVITIDNKYYGGMNASKIEKTLKLYT
jgi:NADH-quinone oxidoreductase subunit E